MKYGSCFWGIRVALCICAVLGWWGFLYPELTMTPDTYQIVDENGQVQEKQEMTEWDFEDNIYWEILQADKSQVRFRSRLWTELSGLAQD